MNYDVLSNWYWQQQVERVADLRTRIASRGSWIEEGRVVPDDEDLVIGTGRRLSMAVMFLDLCGFSGRPCESKEEQELMLRALNLFFTEMLKIAEDYGGVVEKNTGDGLMAYFNDNEGSPPEAGCKRALTAALTMFHANFNLINPVLVRSNVEPFRFRVGIDYGDVTVAQLGAAKRFGSLVAIGSTANVACKMLNVAQPDEIVVGENVFRRLPDPWRQNWCHLKLADTGWVYLGSTQPYRFYRYDGRWTGPKGN